MPRHEILANLMELLLLRLGECERYSHCQAGQLPIERELFQWLIDGGLQGVTHYHHGLAGQLYLSVKSAGKHGPRWRQAGTFCLMEFAGRREGW